MATFKPLVAGVRGPIKEPGRARLVRWLEQIGIWSGQVLLG